MKKFIKRLPCLLLALVIAVLPLMLAVPVGASEDVLVGGNSDPMLRLPSGGDSSLFLPLPADRYSDLSSRKVIIVYTGSVFKFYDLYSDDVTGCNIMSNYITVSYSGSYLLYTYSGGNWVYNGADSSSGTLHIDCVAYGNVRFWTNKSLGLSGGYYFYSVPGTSSVGVFSVFSGVGSWLAGAVNNMIPMFWSAEAGLTPIGVLTVCSLALAVILLLFWLIAGWLKFK